jgi:hypothetical protein
MCFRGKMLKFRPDLVDDARGKAFFMSIGCRCHPRNGFRPDDAYDTAMFLMAPLMFLMNRVAFLMAGLMIFTIDPAVLMVLMASVKSEPGAVATGFFYGSLADVRRIRSLPPPVLI